jgi:Cu/Zn superoxide dismutase
MKAGLLLLMIISAILMAATTICAYEGATHDAIATLKDVKGYTVGLATFTEDASGLVRINVNVSGLKPGCLASTFIIKETALGRRSSRPANIITLLAKSMASTTLKAPMQVTCTT